MGIVFSNSTNIVHSKTITLFSNRLTAQAQEFAEFLAGRNTGLEHCANIPGCNDFGAGENLAFASGGQTVETNATKSW